MYIYESGLIGQAVRAKIENTKSNVMGKGSSDESFGDILKSMMETTENKKPVSVSSSTEKKAISGDSLLYAMRNADIDTTASAVLSALGFSGAGGSSSLKTAAEGLKANSEKLNLLEKGDEASIKTALSAFTGSYNEVASLLTTASGTSAYMYSRGLKTAASLAETALSEAGITIENDGRLSFDPEKYSSLDGKTLATSVYDIAKTISTYSEAIMGDSKDSLLSFLGNDEDNSTVSDYYNALMSSYL